MFALRIERLSSFGGYLVHVCMHTMVFLDCFFEGGVYPLSEYPLSEVPLLVLL